MTSSKQLTGPHLKSYQSQLTCPFHNRGTGAVILAGFINAITLSKTPLPKHRILFFGAGSAGVGVASQLKEHFIRAGGMSEEAARDAFWLVDSKGLVTFDRGDKLPQHKTLFARRDNEGKQYKSLKEVIEYVRPTALIGLSSQGGAFGEENVKVMAEMNERPIVFPLSNPATVCWWGGGLRKGPAELLIWLLLFDFRTLSAPLSKP